MSGDSKLVIQTIKDVTVVNFANQSILDTQVVQQTGEELYQLVDRQARRRIIIDFSAVRFLSSSALGVLMTLRKKADAIKGEVLICGMRPDLYKVFKITHVDRLFRFFDTEEQALNALGVSTAG